MKLFATTAIALTFATSAFAMSASEANIINHIKALGFSDEVVAYLDASEIKQLGVYINNGSDSDQRMAVRGALDHMVADSGLTGQHFLNSGSDSEQRMADRALMKKSNGAGSLDFILHSGDDNEQRRAARRLAQ